MVSEPNLPPHIWLAVVSAVPVPVQNNCPLSHGIQMDRLTIAYNIFAGGRQGGQWAAKFGGKPLEYHAH